MSGYNGAAWLQFHQGRRTGTIPPPDATEERFLCPDCGHLMSREWFTAIQGCSPEEYWRWRPRESKLRPLLGVPDDFKDPSDDPTFLDDQRSIR